MAKFIIDFEWPVATHYQVEREAKTAAHEPKPATTLAEKRQRYPLLYAAQEIRRRISEARGAPDGSATLAGGGRRYGMLVASGPTEMRRPLDGKGAFLKIPLSNLPLEKIVTQAAATYGMLTARSEPAHREPLGLWKQLIDELKEFRSIESTLRNNRDPFHDLNIGGLLLGARLDVLLIPGPPPDRRPRLSFRPVNLREAIKTYWATTLVSGAALRPCAQCSEYFEAGGETGRRADARYCCKLCHDRFNNAKKLKLPRTGPERRL
jgi:hypothetical protein